MTGDLVQIAVGIFFVSWAWTFPRWRGYLRERMVAAGREHRFDTRWEIAAMTAIGRYLVPAMGVVLVASAALALARR